MIHTSGSEGSHLILMRQARSHSESGWAFSDDPRPQHSGFNSQAQPKGLTLTQPPNRPMFSGGAKDSKTGQRLGSEMGSFGVLSGRLVLSARSVFLTVTSRTLQSAHPDRLLLLARAPRKLHHRIKAAADLFLDTLGYGAHITAGDALWSGVSDLVSSYPSMPHPNPS